MISSYKPELTKNYFNSFTSLSPNQKITAVATGVILAIGASFAIKKLFGSSVSTMVSKLVQQILGESKASNFDKITLDGCCNMFRKQDMSYEIENFILIEPSGSGEGSSVDVFFGFKRFSGDVPVYAKKGSCEVNSEEDGSAWLKKIIHSGLFSSLKRSRFGCGVCEPSAAFVFKRGEKYELFHLNTRSLAEAVSSPDNCVISPLKENFQGEGLVYTKPTDESVKQA